MINALQYTRETKSDRELQIEIYIDDILLMNRSKNLDDNNWIEIDITELTLTFGELYLILHNYSNNNWNIHVNLIGDQILSFIPDFAAMLDNDA